MACHTASRSAERKLELMSMMNDKECVEAEVAFWLREATLDERGDGPNVDKEDEPDCRVRPRYSPAWGQNTPAEENQNPSGMNGGRCPTQVEGLKPWAPDWNCQSVFRPRPNVNNGYNYRFGSNVKPVSQSRPDIEPGPIQADLGLGYLDNNRQTGGTQTIGLGTEVNSTLRSMFETTNMPKPELVTFDGSPDKFWSFMNSFKTNIEGKCLDDRTKLTYLIQFCTGKAREIVENSILMQPGEGYAMAKMILADQFGQSYMVSKALLDKVLNWEPLRANDGVGLWDLARQIRKARSR
ncbi:hypothetical protein HOLleu_01773 [Holothuria leucospilota]|uniref:Uncharacterized protein n=1 Tax=Holothuria leucospilota TaxID=206669 RepID=A0A9Q1CPS6_HOLLE|nr:hypothetical protein HOLleu_01773 [Holothuria leucospilota]